MPSLKIKSDDDLNIIINKFIEETKDKPIYKELKEELENILINIDSHDDMYNIEIDSNDKNAEKDEYGNIIGTNSSMYLENLLEGQKILIVMLWTNNMSKTESKWVNDKYIKTPPHNSSSCIESIVSYYGIKVEVVTNYEDAIIKLTTDENGNCPYYCVWVINGPQESRLPNKKDNPNFISQFIDVLILFWNNGGSIVFLADGQPLTYQTNLFLKRAVFENGKKANFQIGGEHLGGKNIKGDKTGELKNNGLFNKKNTIIKNYERPSIGHSLNTFFEGITISYIPKETDISPFKIFAIDSEGGITSLYYPSDLSKRGDIIIDCGFTKLFTNLDSAGTKIYIENIAGWTGRPEMSWTHYNTEPKKWRPKKINFQIDNNPPKWEDFITFPKTIFAFDCSGSINGNELYFNKLRDIIDKYHKNEDDKFYTWGDNYYNKTENEINEFINKKYGNEGTYAINIVNLIKENINEGFDNLIIATDGKIDDIKKCDDELKLMEQPFSFVKTFVIGNDGDLSVGAPFSRNCPHETIHFNENGEKSLINLSNLDFKVYNDIDYINEFLEFENIYKSLYKCVFVRVLGKENGDQDIVNKLNSLKNRICQKINEGNKNIFDLKIDKLIKMANGNILIGTNFSAADSQLLK